MFEVQTYTVCDGWVNTWSDENEVPLRFDTHEEAQKELEDFIKETEEEAKAGNLAEAYSIEDFRVVGV